MSDQREELYKGILREQPITTLEAIRFSDSFLEVLRPELQKHGITIEVYSDYMIANLPEGTTRIEDLPRIHFERYTITTPDGFKFSALATRSGRYNVGLEMESLAPDVQRRCSALLLERE